MMVATDTQIKFRYTRQTRNRFWVTGENIYQGVSATTITLKIGPRLRHQTLDDQKKVLWSD